MGQNASRQRRFERLLKERNSHDSDRSYLSGEVQSLKGGGVESGREGWRDPTSTRSTNHQVDIIRQSLPNSLNVVHHSL